MKIHWDLEAQKFLGWEELKVFLNVKATYRLSYLWLDLTEQSVWKLKEINHSPYSTVTGKNISPLSTAVPGSAGALGKLQV